MTWAPDSWRALPAAEQPAWPDENELALVAKQMEAMPPLVFAGEARKLKAELAAVGAGKAFLLQAGDCAESFGDFSADAIRDKLRVILQVAIVLTYASGLPVVKMGRIAGQFAKPRSSDTEKLQEEELPSFRGHAVNDAVFDVEARTPDPHRMVQAYHQAAATLNLIRAFGMGGFGDLNQVHAWNQQFVAASSQGLRYESIANQIDKALRFMAAIGVDIGAESHLHQVDIYASHEALLLEYEQALTRVDSLTGDWYCCSAHMLWVGERTRQLDGAHVEFLRGVQNPLGCKLGPRATGADVIALSRKLNPENEPGRLTLITRLGAGKVADVLPHLIDAVKTAGLKVTWVCDPMHGNTFVSDSGYKTRRFDDILLEIRGFFAVHQEKGTIPGGVHLEFTHQDVTECLGGAEEVLDRNLETRYLSLCDPRLNPRQSLDLAFEMGQMLEAPQSV